MGEALELRDYLLSLGFGKDVCYARNWDMLLFSAGICGVLTVIVRLSGWGKILEFVVAVYLVVWCATGGGGSCYFG